MRTVAVLITSALLTACSTPKGVFVVEAFTPEGEKIETGVRFLNVDSMVYSNIRVYCRLYRGATLVITDVNTGRELEGESPRKCR